MLLVLVPTIQEEVQDLDTDTVLNKRTSSGKAIATSQSAPNQPSFPKKKRKKAIRKLKLAAYVAEDEEQIVAATDLVTKELEKKKAEDVAALAKIRELAKGIEVPASSIAREDAGIVAQQVVQAAEEVQEMVTSEAGSLLMVAAEGVQEDNVDASEAVIPEALRGNHDSPHIDNVIVVESDSTPSISSQSTSSTLR
jgi:nucleotide-binding universal stress UspA family protein